MIACALQISEGCPTDSSRRENLLVTTRVIEVLLGLGRYETLGNSSKRLRSSKRLQTRGNRR